MKLFFRVFIFLPVFFFALNINAQQNNKLPVAVIPVAPQQVKKKDTLYKKLSDTGKMDLNDFIAKVLKHKRTVKIDSITSKPAVTIIPALGYSLVTELAIVVSGNAAFRTGPDSRISTIVASTSVTQRRQFTLPIQTSIWSKNNQFNYVGDYRFFRYPQSTYGLGSSSSIKNEDPMDYSYFQFYETALRHVVGNLYLGAGYIVDYHWNVTDKGNMNGTVSDYSLYGKNAHSVASGLTLNALFDSRDNAINPFKGAYLSAQYRDNLDFLGSNAPWSSLIIDARKYFRFPEGSDNVLAVWSYDWLTLNGRPAYIDLPSTQWDEESATGRGYIQGRFRGAEMVYGEAEYRYKITDDGLLGGVLFVNGSSFSAAPGTRLQAIQPGYGPGLRVKLNKVSNTNISIDYGFGRQGSNGLFIDIGEIF